MRDRTLSPRVDPGFLQRKDRVWIMGVLNATPDSFYADSRAAGVDEAVAKAERMVGEGVDVLDIGGESSRPGAGPVPLSTELQRVLPILDALHRRWPEIPLSIDTQKADVARQALERGASVVNDISALRHDPEMAGVAAEAGCGVVLMHMQGTPSTMQQNPHYGNLMDELCAFFEERLSAAVRAGIEEDRIVLDPGIGFGKTLDHNLQILRGLSALARLGRSILVGVSRKSFIGRLLSPDPGQTLAPEMRLEGTLAASLWAVEQGAQGLRVHDVGPTRQALAVWESVRSGGTVSGRHA